MAYQVQFAGAAKKQIRKLDGGIRKRISAAIDALAQEPRPDGVKKLAGADDLWRIRVGDYRVIYQIQDLHLVVLIVKIGHRGEVYR